MQSEGWSDGFCTGTRRLGAGVLSGSLLKAAESIKGIPRSRELSSIASEDHRSRFWLRGSRIEIQLLRGDAWILDSANFPGFGHLTCFGARFRGRGPGTTVSSSVWTVMVMFSARGSSAARPLHRGGPRCCPYPRSSRGVAAPPGVVTPSRGCRLRQAGPAWIWRSCPTQVRLSLRSAGLTLRRGPRPDRPDGPLRRWAPHPAGRLLLADRLHTPRRGAVAVVEAGPHGLDRRLHRRL